MQNGSKMLVISSLIIGGCILTKKLKLKPINDELERETPIVNKKFNCTYELYNCTCELYCVSKYINNMHNIDNIIIRRKVNCFLSHSFEYRNTDRLFGNILNYDYLYFCIESEYNLINCIEKMLSKIIQDINLYKKNHIGSNYFRILHWYVSTKTLCMMEKIYERYINYQKNVINLLNVPKDITKIINEFLYVDYTIDANIKSLINEGFVWEKNRYDDKTMTIINNLQKNI